MTTWNIGAASVTRIEEQLGFALMPPEKYFPGFEREVMDRHLGWLAPDHYSPEQNRVVSSVHSWLVRTGQHTLLLDCCAGNHKERPWSPRFNQLDTPYMERLRAAGVAPEDIDIVLCTHLHADHIGWNTVRRDGRWAPTFPNAHYLFSRIEADYWNAATNPAMQNDPRRMAYVDSVLPVVESGQAVMLEGNHALDDGVFIEPAPGHTPGHVIVKLDRRGSRPSGDEHGERAIFCGDALHHPIQVYAPHWAHIADEDAAQAKQTRIRILEQCVETGSLLFPTHFGAPHVVRIDQTNGGFAARFVAGN